MQPSLVLGHQSGVVRTKEAALRVSTELEADTVWIDKHAEIARLYRSSKRGLRE
jgi:hypothetical protein